MTSRFKRMEPGTTGPFAGWTALIEDVNGNLVPRPGGILRQPGSNPWRG
jgi:hypothetical protein